MNMKLLKTDIYLINFKIQGHVLLHIIRSSTDKQSSSRKQREDELSASLLSTADLQAHVIESYKMVSALYMPFKSKAKEQVKRNLPLNDTISDRSFFFLNFKQAKT